VKISEGMTMEKKMLFVMSVTKIVTLAFGS